jgi:hypothetical protein
LAASWLIGTNWGLVWLTCGVSGSRSMDWFWSIVQAITPTDWYRVGAITLAVVIAAAALWGAWWLWWRLPKSQAARLSVSDDKARADVEDNFRKTIGQLLGGAAVLVGAAFAYFQFTQQQQTSHELLISNQVAKGFEHWATTRSSCS